MRWTLLVAAVLSPCALSASPFGTAAVSDAELGTMRGGILLPNGLDLTLGVAIETSIDGQVALRTVVDGAGRISVFSGGEAPQSARPTADATETRAQAPMVTINRGGAGTVMSPVMAAGNANVVVARGPAADPAAGGGVPLSLDANGAAVATPFGAVTLEQTARGAEVVLSNPTLQLRQLVGSATGVVVANTADNRAIDTIATVNIELGNASLLVGSNLLRIDSIAAEAAARNPFR